MSQPLISCQPIGSHSIRRNDESRILIIDQIMIKFTPTEYQLLLILLKEYIVVTDTTLVQALFDSEITFSILHALNKHIDKARSKLRPSGLNIYRVAKYGYILLADLD